MRNSPEININKIKQSRNEIIHVIKKHWSNLTGCEVEDFDTGLKFILDSENPKLGNTKKIHEEIQILNIKNGGTIINISDEIYPEASKIIQEFGLNEIKLGQLLQNKYKGTLSLYKSVRLYLFTDEKLKPVNFKVRKLDKSEKAIFDKFIDKCNEEEKENVYMDFETSFHNFFAYFYNDEVVAIGEYCKIHDDDEIVIPSIITDEKYRGRGFGKAVVNAMTHDILEKGYIPQYRCDPENTSSRNLAKSLGYEEIIDGYSLRINK